MYLTKQAKKEIATRIYWGIKEYNKDTLQYDFMRDNMYKLQILLDSMTLCPEYAKITKELQEIWTMAAEMYGND